MLLRRLVLWGVLWLLACIVSSVSAQVPAELLPVLKPSGDYVRNGVADIRVVAVSKTGFILECSRETPPGVAPVTWREKYAIRDGHLVLDSVLTPRTIPAQAAHTEWQSAPKIGSSSIGPAGLDPRWNSFPNYIQAVIEAVESEWRREIDENPVRCRPGSVVAITFMMNSHGEVTDILAVQPSLGTPGEATVPCVRAVNVHSPYGEWTEDMIASLGDHQKLTFSFYYPYQ